MCSSSGAESPLKSWFVLVRPLLSGTYKLELKLVQTGSYEGVTLLLAWELFW